MNKKYWNRLQVYKKLKNIFKIRIYIVAMLIMLGDYPLFILYDDTYVIPMISMSYLIICSVVSIIIFFATSGEIMKYEVHYNENPINKILITLGLSTEFTEFDKQKSIIIGDIYQVLSNFNINHLLTTSDTEQGYLLMYDILNDTEVLQISAKIKAILETPDFKKLLEDDKKILYVNYIQELFTLINKKYDLTSFIKFNTNKAFIYNKLFDSDYKNNKITYNQFETILKEKNIESFFTNKTVMYAFLFNDRNKFNYLRNFLVSKDDLKNQINISKDLKNKINTKYQTLKNNS